MNKHRLKMKTTKEQATKITDTQVKVFQKFIHSQRIREIRSKIIKRRAPEQNQTTIEFKFPV